MTDTQADLVARLHEIYHEACTRDDGPYGLTDALIAAKNEIELLRASNKQMAEALEEMLEAFSLGPLGCAAKYGPDVDVREVEGRAVDMARAALKDAPNE